MPIIQADYRTTLSSNLSSTGTTFDVATPPTLTEGVLVLARGQSNEEWVYMSSVTGSTITVSHRGLSKTSGTLTEVTANKQIHYAGETVEWVNHPVHIINKRGDTVYGNLLMDSTKEIQFTSSAQAIWNNGGNLSFKDGVAGTKTLDSLASTSTKLDDFGTPDDNTDLNATTGRHGLMQKYPGGTSTYLRADGDWGTPSLSIGTAWDITTVTLDGKSFDTSAIVGNNDIWFRENGGTMYILDSTTDSVYQYTLSTPWDVSTATYSSKTFSFATQTTTPQGIDVKPDGKVLYITSNTDKTIYQYVLSSAFDVSTLSYDSKSLDISSEISTSTVNGVRFSTNGDKLYVVSYGTVDNIYQYTLSTPWDVSTATYDSKSFSPTSYDTNPRFIFFKHNGLECYLLGATNKNILQFTLSTAWDISTAVYTNSKYIGGSFPSPVSFYISDDGSLLYVMDGADDQILEYAFSTTIGYVSTDDTSATDNTIVREDGTTGTKVQKSLVSIDDSGSINIPTGQTYKINGTSLAKGDVGLGNVTNDAQVKKISSATDNAIVRWDDTTGALIQDSLVTIDDSGSVNIPTGQAYKINGTALAKGDVGLGNVDNLSNANQTTLGTVTSGNVDAIIPAGERWHVYKSSVQEIATATSTNLTWDTELYDTDGFHSTSTNTDRITIPAGLGGIYLLTVSIAWEAIVATAAHALKIRKNDSGDDAQTFEYNISNTNLCQRMTFQMSLEAGDYVVIEVQQNTGSSIDILSESYLTSWQGIRLFAN